MESIENKPKGILKKPSVNFQQRNKLKWDEDNIQLTEGQKNSTMKITEPKTPYIHYNQDTDEIMTDLRTIPGLMLGSSSIGNNNNNNLGSSNNVSPVGSLSSVSPSSAHFPDSIKDEWESDSEEDEAIKEKRRRFAELRAKHYNMKEALSLGHKLVENDIDDDENSNVCELKAKILGKTPEEEENEEDEEVDEEKGQVKEQKENDHNSTLNGDNMET